MANDQEVKAPPLPAGWAFGKSSIKPHWFDAGHITSICGKSASTTHARNNRVAYPSDCSQCKHKLERRARGEDE